MTSKHQRPLPHQAPLALASDGSVLINLVRLVEHDDLDRVIQLARGQRCPVFVGVVVPRAQIQEVLKDIDDAAAEIAARVGGKLQPRGDDR